MPSLLRKNLTEWQVPRQVRRHHRGLGKAHDVADVSAEDSGVDLGARKLGTSNTGANTGARKLGADVDADMGANRCTRHLGTNGSSHHLKTNTSSQQYSANGSSFSASDIRANDKCTQPVTSVVRLQQAPRMQSRRSER